MGLRRANDGGGLRRVETREYPRDAKGLLHQLQDPDPAVRRWAAKDLAVHPGAASAICRHLTLEVDHAVREVLFTTLGMIKGRDVVEGLVPLLRSEDPGLRNSAIEVLGGLPEDVAPFVGELLADADPDVRIFTLNVLTDLQHPDVGNWLAQVLDRDEHVNVVAAALEVAAEAGNIRLLPAIRSARQRFAHDAFIGFAAELAEQRIETP